MRILLLSYLLAVVGGPLSVFPSVALAQSHRERIHGTVTDSTGQPIRGVSVTITRAPDRLVLRTTTDSSGRYEIMVDSGTGDYLVHIADPRTPVLAAFRKRLLAKAPNDSVFEVNASLKMPAGAQQLNAVVVRARKPIPARSASLEPGSGESAPEGVTAALPPGRAGEIAAMLELATGALPTQQGGSLLGVSAAQNSTTLNGLAFASGSIPGEAKVVVKHGSAPFDPARGWFGGAETRIELSQDVVLAGRSARLAADHPSLQWSNALRNRLGQSPTSAIISGGAFGLLLDEGLTYNLSAQASHSSAREVPLEALDRAVLGRAGLNSDSAARAMVLLQEAGIPLRGARASTDRVREAASFLAGISTAATDPFTYRTAPTVIALTAFGSHQASAGRTVGPLVTSSRDAQTSIDAGTLQAMWSSYPRKEVIEEVRSSISGTWQRSEPGLRLPSGMVFVDSQSDSTGITAVEFGGSREPTGTTRTLTWETQSDTRFFAYGNSAHRIRLVADGRLDAAYSDIESNAAGSFAYASLRDLEMNAPFSFTRSLTAPRITTRAVNWFVALSDTWKPTSAFSMLIGGRLEGGTFLDRPALNRPLESVLGIRNDRTPSSVHFSPRVGFTWNLNGKSRADYTVANALGRFTVPRAGVLRGGIGEFRALMPLHAIANAQSRTGLGEGVQQLTCLGTAVPTPDWRTYFASATAIPSNCAGGGESGVYSDHAPDINLLDRSFTAARSWRGELSWSSMVAGLSWVVEATHSENLNQPGRRLLNFSGVPRFVMTDEARSVFVSPTSILATNGAVSPVESRRSSAFGTVTALTSDLRSRASRLRLSVIPYLGNAVANSSFASLTYSYTAVRSFERGSDGSTFGTPDVGEWGRSPYDVRHNVVLQAGIAARAISVTIFGRVRSGMPFTPRVGSDVNGDGLTNDRAFIFDPANTTDTTVSLGLRNVLDHAPEAIRSCLTRQFGRAAARNSCESPWSADVNAQIDVRLGQLANWGKRVRIGIFLANPLGGLDQLLHGADLHGWGSPALPDPTLYFVNGFDQARQRFAYTVNPKFGTTRSSLAQWQVPFRMTIDIKVDLGASVSVQLLDRALRSGRDGHKGVRRSAAELRGMYSRAVPDAFAPIVMLTDSLLLTTSQVRALEEARMRWRAEADSLWAALALYLASLPDRYDANRARREQDAVATQVWELSRVAIRRELPVILNVQQQRLLPWPAAMLLRAERKLSLEELTGRR